MLGFWKKKTFKNNIFLVTGKDRDAHTQIPNNLII